MTLQNLLDQTAGMPPSNPIKILAIWGGFIDPAFVTIEDLCEDDPARNDFPPNALVITESAEPESSH